MRFKRPLRWLLFLIIGVVLVTVLACLNRNGLERAVIAYAIHKKNIFTPPSPAPGGSRLQQFRANTRFYLDLADLRMRRDQRVKELEPELKSLLKEINRHQARGESMEYSMHIYREIRWRLNFTNDIQTTRARLEDLRQSLNRPDLQKQATLQQASDGSWGMGINVWYLRLYYSVDQIQDIHGLTPAFPLSFLDRVNTPEKMAAQLDADLNDDFTKTGVFNREELDETFSALARLVLQTKNPPYHFNTQLPAALRDFVNRWQNPATGCWGQWLLDRQGRIWKMDDVGITFHVISDLDGRVDHLDLIAKRILQLDQIDFPVGIRMNGHYENHLNWDAVKIFRIAWPTLDDATRKQASAEISRMLDWCLTHSLQPDSSFKTSDLDDTMGDAYTYGVNFLRETGYFPGKNHFWTDRDFPDAKAVHDRIEASLKDIAGKDPGLTGAYRKLQEMDGSFPSHH